MYLFKVLQRLSNLLNLQLPFQFSSKRISCCPRFSSLDCQSIYVCPHVRAPLPSFCHNHYPIFEAHYHCQIMIIASVFDIRQPKWRLSIVDCQRHCRHTHKHIHSASFCLSLLIIIMRVFAFLFGELSNIGTLRRTFLGNFTDTLPMLSQFLQIKRGEILPTQRGCQDVGRRSARTIVWMMRRDCWHGSRRKLTDRRRRWLYARRPRLAFVCSTFLLKFARVFGLHGFSFSLSLSLLFSSFTIWLIYGAYCAFNRRPHGVCVPVACALLIRFHTYMQCLAVPCLATCHMPYSQSD